MPGRRGNEVDGAVGHHHTGDVESGMIGTLEFTGGG